MAQPVPAIIYHMTTAESYAVDDAHGGYKPEYFDEEGFIHTCAEPEWVERIGARVFAADTDILLLEVETARVRAEIIVEAAKNHWFPHIFGSLNRDAVLRSSVMARDADGSPVFPPDWR
ncbi:DUF952 domain-containing protein [Candidatus Poribacteria bacterium]|nr:DUF952 domain-containing protein [Candidatus Poribacteria bacterium]MBT5535446.1 DUF952 domain-containing protein [Candidatus Poribacteria bacterium]MBT5709437.1 DUF952 domain-containing protein [Candidatus Poribacteria bacterium]MBT7097971.1 DUF952 domain-containing protein [Candidatus Poribacteria bacterium]MBT7807697.1 DUF952 domain-containing protein [Candidatus Poribacteria bacterium]